MEHAQGAILGAFIVVTKLSKMLIIPVFIEGISEDDSFDFVGPDKTRAKTSRWSTQT
jgi:hypothetical protein